MCPADHGRGCALLCTAVSTQDFRDLGLVTEESRSAGVMREHARLALPDAAEVVEVVCHLGRQQASSVLQQVQHTPAVNYKRGVDTVETF